MKRRAILWIFGMMAVLTSCSTPMPSVQRDKPVGDDVRLVKYASSATALYDDWSPTIGGAQYVSFVSIAKAALTDRENNGVDFETITEEGPVRQES